MAQFELTVETDPQQGVARLRLADGAGRHLGGGAVRLADHSTWFWEGLFDAQEHVDRYAGAVRRGGAERPATAEELLAELGVFLGEKVLGREAMEALKGMAHRTLVVRLPPTEDDPLAAAFARVPWEIARPKPGAEPLMARNLVVRAVAAGVEDGGEAPGPGPGEPLRVLLVFAEAPGSRPLAMRLERQRLLELFHDEVLPERQVEVEVLCHGVTRERLQAAVREGCHVLHWSGHGHQDLLELQGEDGGADVLTGAELVDLLQAAGGFIPRLVFLSACLSGALVEARSFEELGAALAGARPGRRAAEVEAAALDQLLGERRGYTSTALALLRAGVPQVVAMRYEVGDAYARDLARGFYKDLLAGKARLVDSALTLARGDLLRRKGDWYSAVDHATPLVLGREGLVVSAPAGRSAALDRWRPRPQPLLPHPNRELEPAPGFVGRGRELTRLGREWLPRGGPAVALLQGLAGLGKTALAAEAVDLWHRDFDWVFAFQAKPGELKLEDFLRRLDERWTLASGAYRQRCEGSPYLRVFLPVAGELTGARRYEVLRDNLVEAMSGERVLLVLDNFETNLETVPGEGGLRCLDPEWDRLLGELAERLPGTGSRVLVTSRHRLACLAGEGRAVQVALAALPMGEAALYLQSHPDLAAMATAGDEGWALARRLLRVSRGHPLILTRLGNLARDRRALAAALERLESEGLSALSELPDPFAGKRTAEEREKERLYIEDVAVRSMDLLLGRVSEPARRLLWVASLGFEPVEEPVLRYVWEQGSEEPPAGPLLAELLAAGLLGGEGEEGGRPLSCHELVRERAAAWMAVHPAERAGRTAEQVWTAYGEIYEALFWSLMKSGQPGSRDLAAQVGRRGVSSLLRARAFDRLGSFASGLVTGTRDRALLGTLIAELEAAAGEVPPGKPRWRLRTYLADALRNSGQPDRALPVYEQAAAEAEEAGHWRDAGWICQNWANALGEAGRLDETREIYLRSAEAVRRAGSPRVEVVGNELEALRLDVMQGEAGRALPEIESRLAELRDWWRRVRAGEEVPEAPNPVVLGRALVSGLNVAHEANLSLERWQACLDLLAETEETQHALGEGEHERAGTRFNRYGPLLRLSRLAEAQGVLEGCLAVFRRAEDAGMEAATRSALAALWDARAEPARAADLERQALAVKNLLPDPEDRSISHGNLSNYLDRSGQPEDAARHQLAAIAYAFVTGQRQHLAVFFRNLSIHIRRAAAAGGRYELPRLADLLARPDFTPLRQFLAECGADPAELQAAIDQIVEQIRAAAAGEAPGQGQDVPGPPV